MAVAEVVESQEMRRGPAPRAKAAGWRWCVACCDTAFLMLFSVVDRVEYSIAMPANATKLTLIVEE